MPTLTLQQLLKRQTILGVVQRLVTPNSMIQATYGMLPGQRAVRSVSGRDIGWDLYDATRQTAKGRAPLAPPAVSPKKPIGHVNAQAFRMHDSIILFEEEIFQTRPLGGAIGTVDERGRDYVSRQIRTLTDKYRNAREFMASRVMMGGFGVKVDGDDHFLLELGGSGETFQVLTQIPAAHLSQLEMGTGGNILDASWHLAGTDIVGHLYSINRALIRVSGRGLKHVWMNSQTFKSTLLVNTGLRALGGSAMTVHEALSRKEVKNYDGQSSDGGFIVIFRAIPWVTFHIYDAVLNVGSAPDSTAVADSTDIIPTNKALFTPEVDREWIGWVEGSEVIAENVMSPGREVKGFDLWPTRVIDPAGWQLKGIDNGLPGQFVPKATAFGTVIF